MTEYTIQEASFMSAVIGYCRVKRCLVYHTHDARRSEPGFPDLVIARPDIGVLYRELKTNRGRLTADQRRWLDVLKACGADAGVWTPASWGEIEDTIGGVRRGL